MDEHILTSQLQTYCESGIYPMHMPGHKRALSPVPGLPYAQDVTEVPGTDDLHHAGGILRDAMDRASSLFGSRRTWFLVNGSTCGVLASIYACVPAGGEIIAARSCHKSVFHAIELLSLTVHWLLPSFLPDWGICGSISPAEVGRLLAEHPAAKTVIITSPTYEGVVSDIARIARICHAAGARLIVDEAHGAHLGLFPEGKETGARPEESFAKSGGSSPQQVAPVSDASRRMAGTEIFPDSALHHGADIVIQSAHKTLPSLTQTALLHLGHPFQEKYDSSATGTPRAAADAFGAFHEPAVKNPMDAAGQAAPDASDREEEKLRRLEASIEHALDIFETSSPSYPLMASLDGCVGLLRNRGEELFADWRRQIRLTEETCAGLFHLQLLRGFARSGESSESLAHGKTPSSSAATAPRSEDGFGLLAHGKTPSSSAATAPRSEDSSGPLPRGKGAGNPDVQEGKDFPVFRLDGSKLLFRADSPCVTGEELCALFEEAGIEPEMYCGRNVLLMSGCGDTEEGWEKLRRALLQVDARLQDAAKGEAGAEGVQARAGESLFFPEVPDMAMEPAAVRRALLEGRTVTCPLEEAAGGICAEYVCAYPPGIPILLPGECITPQAVRLIRELTRQGTRLQCSASAADAQLLTIITK